MRRTPPQPKPARSVESDIKHSRLRLLGVALLCAKVAIVPVVFDYSADAVFTIPKALTSHGLSYLLLGVVAALLIRFGWAFFVRSWLHVPVLAFLAANVASTLFAADTLLALYGAHLRMLGLATIGDCVVLYFAVVLLVRTRTEAAVLTVCALGASLVVLAYELVQRLGADPLFWNADEVARPFSTIGQATSLGQYLTILAVGCVGVGLLVRLPLAARAFAFAMSAALIAGAGITGTRSAALGLIAASAVLVVLLWVLHPSRWARVGSVVTAFTAAVVLGLLLAFTPLGTRLAATIDVPAADDASDEPTAGLDASSEARAAIYAIAFQMLQERPILGFGPDNFAVGTPRYRAELTPYEIRQSLTTSAHGWVTHIAATSGLVGLGTFLAIVVLAFAVTLKTGFRPLAIVGATMLAAFLGTGLTTINDVATEWLFWVAVGMIAAVTARPAALEVIPESRGRKARTSKNEGASHVSWSRQVVTLACVLGGLALALSVVNAWDASRSMRSAQLSRLQGKASEALALALRATNADPRRAGYWDGLGLAYLANSRILEASTAFERASQLAPYDVRYIGDFARTEVLLLGNGNSVARAKAIELAELATRIDPNNPLAHLTKAVVMQATGNAPEGLRAVQRALALDPGSGNDKLWVTATQLLTASGQPLEAVRVARQGLATLGVSRRSIDLRVELARSLVAAGRPLEAIAELDAALAIQPNEPSIQRLRAQIAAGSPPSP